MTHRERLIRCLESLLPLLEERADAGGDGFFVSSQQPFGEVASCLWHLRKGRVPKLWPLALLFADPGPLAPLAESNGWATEYRELQKTFQEGFLALNRIRYHASEDPVLLGDQVSVRLFFRRRLGRVTYLPGLSKPQREIDFGGIFSVGIQIPEGPFMAIPVDPDSLELKKAAQLLRRDSSPTPPCPTDEELSDDA